MKASVVLMVLLAIIAGVTPSYAHEEKKGHPKPKHAIHELNEAKEILGKLTPDADGHIAKASQSIDHAIQELSAVKDEPKK